MGITVEVDEIDSKILNTLTRDARTRLKDIAKNILCFSAQPN
jgi:DNA-binding Lrp family transcriptional regulator